MNNPDYSGSLHAPPPKMRPPPTKLRFGLKPVLSALLLSAGAFTARPVFAVSDLYVGSNTSGNSTNFTSGTNIFGQGYVGYTNTSSSNSLIVANTNTVLQFTNTAFGNQGLFIGNYGSYNIMTVSNGGAVNILASGSLYIGNQSTSSNNSLIVTGTNSTLNSYVLAVGVLGSGNSLVITNGGVVVNSYGIISNSLNNSVLIIGNNSLWSNAVSVDISGVLIVANGGTLKGSLGGGGILNIGRFGTNDTAGSIISPTINGLGTINFNQSNTNTLTNSISGNGTINQLGSGKSILSASNSFGGSTIVSAGTLMISATGYLSGSGTTTVNSGGKLQNNGLIAGTTIANGNIAGNGGTFGSLKINGGSGLIWDISSLTGAAGIGWDALNTTNLDLSGMSSSNKMTIYIYGGTGAGNASPSYTFTFLSATNTFSGFNMSNFIINTSNFAPSVAGTWSIGTNSLSSGGEALSLTYAVPEPSTYALFGIGTLGLLVVMRRKFV